MTEIFYWTVWYSVVWCDVLLCGMINYHEMQYDVIHSLWSQYHFQPRYCRMKRKKKGGFGTEFNGASNTQVHIRHNDDNASDFIRVLTSRKGDLLRMNWACFIYHYQPIRDRFLSQSCSSSILLNACLSASSPVSIPIHLLTIYLQPTLSSFISHYA